MRASRSKPKERSRWEERSKMVERPREEERLREEEEEEGRGGRKMEKGMIYVARHAEAPSKPAANPNVISFGRVRDASP